MGVIITEYPQFFKTTILDWKKLLKLNNYKYIVVESLKFLVESKRIKLFAFELMENHLHLIWQMIGGVKPADVQRDFLKYTAQQIKKDLVKNHKAVLEQFKVGAKDRQYQFWERNVLSIVLRTDKVFK